MSEQNKTSLDIDNSEPFVPEQDFLDDPLTGHSYDGIQEYDNPLPGWWKFLFWATIIFSPFYYFYFHMGPESRSIYGQYEAHRNRITEASFAEIGDLTADKDVMLQFLRDPELQKWRDFGRSVYQTHCATCHGNNGEGGVGPNLTDNVWKNVRTIEDIAKVIENGAGNGAMPAWKNRLSHQNHIILVSVYVASMMDNPLPGVRPEGNITIESWD